MISFDEYYQYLKKRKVLSFHYAEQFQQLAENSKYLRSKRIIRRYQKEVEKERSSSFNVLNNIFKDEQKKKGVKAVIKVNTTNDSKLKLFFKRIFRIKPPVVSGIIEEFSEYPETSTEETKNQEIEAVVIGDEEFEDSEDELDEGSDDFEDNEEFESVDYSEDKIEGQMDIEELNEGEVYDKA